MGPTMDPFATLGVTPGAAPDELAAAYRRAAKRWHPTGEEAPTHSGG
jgi:curved DNA-binding protein CbpA